MVMCRLSNQFRNVRKSDADRQPALLECLEASVQIGMNTKGGRGFEAPDLTLLTERLRLVLIGAERCSEIEREACAWEV